MRLGLPGFPVGAGADSAVVALPSHQVFDGLFWILKNNVGTNINFRIGKFLKSFVSINPLFRLKLAFYFWIEHLRNEILVIREYVRISVNRIQQFQNLFLLKIRLKRPNIGVLLLFPIMIHRIILKLRHFNYTL